MNVPLLDLRAQYAAIKAEIDAAIAEVMQSQQFILGQKVEACEEAIARYSNCAHGIGVSSGSDALLACLMAEGIGPGDEVITTAYTFFATAGAIARAGARPVFVDIDPLSFNLDASQIAGKISARTRAIIPVHLYGQMADMDGVMAAAERCNLVVIEDAAQAIGAEHRGRRAGSIGHYGCFSFFPTKNLGGAGDGGMIVTNDGQRAARLRMLRDHGARAKHRHAMIGGNFRLDALQAAIVLAKLPHLDEWIRMRQENARRYGQLLGQAGAPVTAPAVRTNRHVFNQYVIRAPKRDQLQAFLKQRGIGSEVYYPIPLHLQECFANLGMGPGTLVESERAAKQALAIPVYPELSQDQLEYVAECIAEFCNRQAGQSSSAWV